MSIDPTFAASAGAIALALAATLWAISQRRQAVERIAGLTGEVRALQTHAEVAQASAEAFESAVIVMDQAGVRLASGAESLAACAVALGLGAQASADDVLEALRRSDPDHARKLAALATRGEACDFEARGPGSVNAPGGSGMVVVEGRSSGALVWLRVSAGTSGGIPAAARFAAFLDAHVSPAWILGQDGRLLWANRAWLTGAEATSVEDAVARRASFDRSLDALATQAGTAHERRRVVHWIPVDGRRRAFLVLAQPLEGGGVGVLALDVTEQEETRERLHAQDEAHAQTLNRLGDAVATFSPQRRLAFHNTAFADLWGLEPAWLAEGPTHSEVLDRLRQRRRLPETVDYAAFKARELEVYESLRETPDELWSLPDGRTLRVVRQPDASGGLLLIFSDLTDELKLRAQYNALVQVQQATLDKLNDAVAVFGSDGRLRLHNDAFERFWAVSPQSMSDAGDFDGVVQLCLPLVHDRQFWAELKARVADPDPQARAPISGEIRTSDRRVVSFQTRPLPDGATLIAFDDITATRELEQAVAERSAALAEAERLKRDFVGNVSYELRTPLTTIIGYSELLDRQGEALPERSRGHIASVRAAAVQLARSIDDVLDMAQIDAGEMALSVGDVSVAGLLGEAAARASRGGEEAGVKVTVEPLEGGFISADAKRLGQVLDHLVANALRSTPAGGQVTLSAKRAFGEVQLKVSDTGRGIPFHVQAHIFDRFVGRDRGGPGLGLALVKALVELHGGWVDLESEPGQGAAFTCHLPEAAYAPAVERRALSYG